MPSLHSDPDRPPLQPQHSARFAKSVLCLKPAIFRERTFDLNSGSCDKVSGKGRLKWDLSQINMSKLNSQARTPNATRIWPPFSPSPPQPVRFAQDGRRDIPGAGRVPAHRAIALRADRFSRPARAPEPWLWARTSTVDAPFR